MVNTRQAESRVSILKFRRPILARRKHEHYVHGRNAVVNINIRPETFLRPTVFEKNERRGCKKCTERERVTLSFKLRVRVYTHHIYIYIRTRLLKCQQRTIKTNVHGPTTLFSIIIDARSVRTLRLRCVRSGADLDPDFLCRVVFVYSRVTLRVNFTIGTE